MSYALNFVFWSLLGLIALLIAVDSGMNPTGSAVAIAIAVGVLRYLYNGGDGGNAN